MLVFFNLLVAVPPTIAYITISVGGDSNRSTNLFRQFPGILGMTALLSYALSFIFCTNDQPCCLPDVRRDLLGSLWRKCSAGSLVAVYFCSSCIGNFICTTAAVNNHMRLCTIAQLLLSKFPDTTGATSVGIKWSTEVEHLRQRGLEYLDYRAAINL